MTGKNCDFFTHKSSQSYLNHLVISYKSGQTSESCSDMRTLPNLFDEKFCNIIHQSRPVLIPIKISVSMTARAEV
jgi:hypothetical protein